jgi:hypothetical protein
VTDVLLGRVSVNHPILNTITKDVDRLRLRNFDDITDAIQRKLAVVFTLRIGGDINMINELGVPPLAGRDIGSQSFIGVGMILEPRTGTWRIKAQGSFGPRWAKDGFIYFNRGHFKYLTEGYALLYPASGLTAIAHEKPLVGVVASAAKTAAPAVLPPTRIVVPPLKPRVETKPFTPVVKVPEPVVTVTATPAPVTPPPAPVAAAPVEKELWEFEPKPKVTPAPVTKPVQSVPGNKQQSSYKGPRKR